MYRFHDKLTRIPDRQAKHVFVERSGEVALQQFVVVHRFGNDAPHELVVAEVVGVAVRRRVDGVRNTVAGRRFEQCIVGVEDLTRYDQVPLSQQAACILTLLSCKV